MSTMDVDIALKWSDHWKTYVPFSPSAKSRNEVCFALADEVRRLRQASRAINIIFDGPPGPTPGRFVEVETDDIQELLTIAERDLPEEWVIEIFIQQDGSGVRLEDPDGDGMQCDFAGLSIEDQVKVAIKTAQSQNYRWTMNKP